ncbi:MAG: tRNA pseudouridine(38-40) synthase TruA [Holosporales bacterium]|jgi:tRNA pseudouridine38-40 synthase|nr:tRNA pseudouridine(38-40) synthase TruA [Holosporales bacterium]
MPRYKITLEYNGSFFCGWQRQHSDADVREDSKQAKNCTCSTRNQHSVQGALEHALLKITGNSVLVEGAGRTDAGVHAFAQCAHFDLNLPIEPHRLIGGLNFYTSPHACVVLKAEFAPSDFHARFSATSREYVYKINNRRPPLALDRGRAWHVPRALDVDKIKTYAHDFWGNHNFNAFRSSACQSKNPRKTLDMFNVVETNEMIECHVKARSFLHNQVRIMVGTLVWIGLGKYEGDVIKQLLNSGERTASGPTAPAHGLYLSAVHYANHEFSNRLISDVSE